MVVPSPTPAMERRVIDKKELRADLKRRRRDYVNNAIPADQRGLLFRRPPQAIVALLPADAVIGLYFEVPAETPASHYARWFFERGHRIALPWFAERNAPMQFRQWSNPMLHDLDFEPAPFDDGTFNWLQPSHEEPLLVPDVIFCPLLGFSDRGDRIGYGGGNYDTWLCANSPKLKIGLAWDCQLEDAIPLEPHDQPLDLVVTQTRVYGPWS